jgi:hypothetical protein
MSRILFPHNRPTVYNTMSPITAPTITTGSMYHHSNRAGLPRSSANLVSEIPHCTPAQITGNSSGIGNTVVDATSATNTPKYPS